MCKNRNPWVIVSANERSKGVGAAIGVALAKNKLNNVLQGIDNAIQAGFDPLEGRLKINCVIKKNINDNQILNLVHFAKAKSIEIRFIEYMDVGNKNNWQANEVLKSHELISIIKEHFKINEAGRLIGNTAHKWLSLIHI